MHVLAFSLNIMKHQVSELAGYSNFDYDILLLFSSFSFHLSYPSPQVRNQKENSKVALLDPWRVGHLGNEGLNLRLGQHGDALHHMPEGVQEGWRVLAVIWLIERLHVFFDLCLG